MLFQTTEQDEDMMRRAIEEARRSSSGDPSKPRVGAVIAIGGAILGTGFRGEHDHAEKNAIEMALKTDPGQLAKASLYTTLEPCTGDVRSDTLTCCTALIQQHRLARVFIGILDPNQGVRGKGFWELQDNKIPIVLFPPELAEEIRVLNANFIRFHQRLGLKITNVKDGEEIRTWDKQGRFELEGTYENSPGPDAVAFTFHAGKWYPQPNELEVNENHKTWRVTVYFGAYGPHAIYVAKAGELGKALVKYYWDVVGANKRTKTLLIDNGVAKELLNKLPGPYLGVTMGRLPKGLEMQARVDVIVQQPPS
jgi:pyrimidine deaminase RibD-like protein